LPGDRYSEFFGVLAERGLINPFSFHSALQNATVAPQKKPKISNLPRLTRCTNFPDNSRMTFAYSLFALIAPRRRVLRAWRVAVCPGAGVE
jgi:hypothetical protein